MPRLSAQPRQRMQGTNGVVFALFVLLLLAAADANAQTTGRISGTVRDQTEAVIAGAALTLTNLATNSNSTTSTGSDGGYLFAVVEAGSYRLAVEHPGFKTSMQNHVQLEVNQNELLDVTLEIGNDPCWGGRASSRYIRRGARQSRKRAAHPRPAASRPRQPAVGFIA